MKHFNLMEPWITRLKQLLIDLLCCTIIWPYFSSEAVLAGYLNNADFMLRELVEKTFLKHSLVAAEN